MTEIALLGHPVAHSLSPKMHNAAFRALGLPFHYVAIDVETDRLASAVQALIVRGARGANVTIPHKKGVMTLCNRLDAAAREVGAVNTLVMEENAVLGSNTDVGGMVELLRESQPETVVILGNGGAALAARAAARQLGAKEVVVIARTPQASELPWEPKSFGAVLPTADTLINASAMGHSGAKAPCEVPVELLPKGAVVLDCVYEPRDPSLLVAARQCGYSTFDGLALLLAQGALSFSLWTGQPAPLSVMRETIRGQS